MTTSQHELTSSQRPVQMDNVINSADISDVSSSLPATQVIYIMSVCYLRVHVVKNSLECIE